ncbi:hypothetical protein ElyMa_004958700 [Elysia marginata]|uniref:TRPM tetramerisation domain-containing protein n=1 Tax=Elysia marginata TaxID=1093978 RepID=A0AAV4J144_9GAST|nr:hypothetical protein ElyMa_004958700 [Elysia marginata]
MKEFREELNSRIGKLEDGLQEMRRDVVELKEVYGGMRKDISYMAEDMELLKERTSHGGSRQSGSTSTSHRHPEITVGLNARHQRKSPAQRTRAAAPTQRGGHNRREGRHRCPLSSNSKPTLPYREYVPSEVAPDSRVPLPGLQQEKPLPEPSPSRPNNLDEPAQHLFTLGVRQGRPLTRSQQRCEDSDEATTGPTATST